MSYQSIPLLAGKPHRLDIAGRLILIDSVGTSDGVSIEILLAGSSKTTTVPRRKAGFRMVQAYDGVILTSEVDALVGLFLSNDDVQLGVADGAAVSLPGGVNITNPEPIPVLFGGTVAPVLGVVTVDNTSGEAIPIAQVAGTTFTTEAKPMGSLVNPAPVVVGLAATALIADATLKRLRIRNGHATAIVALGGAGVTLANAAIQLLPGDIWLEKDAAGAAWFAVSDTAGTPVQVNGVK